jgi:hypothetical protein
MQRMVWQPEPAPLFGRKPIFHQRQIQVFVPSVKFVSDDGMADVSEVDADLVFSAGFGLKTQKSKGLRVECCRLKGSGRKR